MIGIVAAALQFAAQAEMQKQTGLIEYQIGHPMPRPVTTDSAPCRYCGRTRHLAKHTTCESCGAPR